MHDTAYTHAQLFFSTYAATGQPRILEIGSADLNGGLRGLTPAGTVYVGADFVSAPGVDVVLDNTMTLPFPDGSFDICVTSSCFEHASCFWQTTVEVARVLKPGGLFYVNAPAAGPYHAHPRDCWRFLPDAGIALQEWSAHAGQELVLLESFVAAPGLVWSDFVAVFARAGGCIPEQRMVDRLSGCTEARRLGRDGLVAIKRPPLTMGRRSMHQVRRAQDRLVRRFYRLQADIRARWAA